MLEIFPVFLDFLLSHSVRMPGPADRGIADAISFGARDLWRMMRFAEFFPDSEIVTPLVSQLSWTYFTLLIKLPSDESRSFYIH